jgi:tetratricopeptide (TPR) repeat protein
MNANFGKRRLRALALVFMCFSLLPVLSRADVDAWIAAGLEAEKRHEPAAALEHFRRAAEVRPEDAFLQQKVAKQLSDSAFLEKDETVRKRLATEALEHAHRAVDLAPESAVNRLSLAVLYGKVAVYSDVRTKVDYARRIRQHAEEALGLDPGYAWAHHVLGRWHLEMSHLGAARRALAGLFFGGIPRASLEQAVRHLERAVELEPDALAHRVELGFAYAHVKREASAVEQWRRALALPSVEIYDESAKQRARLALQDGSRSDRLAERVSHAEP